MECAKEFFADESGATAVEYAIIMVLIAGAIILALAALGESLSGLYTNWAGKVEAI